MLFGEKVYIIIIYIILQIQKKNVKRGLGKMNEKRSDLPQKVKPSLSHNTETSMAGLLFLMEAQNISNHGRSVGQGVEHFFILISALCCCV